MNKFLRLSLSIPANLVPLKSWLKIVKREIFIINYHTVSDAESDPEIRKISYRGLKQLEEDIKYLQGHFNIIGLREFLDCSRKDQCKLPPNSLLFTFDDGVRAVYNNIFPVFRKYAVPATLFLNNAFIDNKDLHFERKISLLKAHIRQNMATININEVLDLFLKQDIQETDIDQAFNLINYHNRHILEEIATTVNFSFQQYLLEHKPYLGARQIQEMIDEGFTIGGHSIDHPRYQDLPLEEQVTQTIDSVNQLKAMFDLDYSIFAFPYKDESIASRFFEEIQGSVDMTFGTLGLRNDLTPNHFQRFGIEKSGFRPSTAVRNVFFQQFFLQILGRGSVKRVN